MGIQTDREQLVGKIHGIARQDGVWQYENNCCCAGHNYCQEQTALRGTRFSLSFPRHQRPRKRRRQRNSRSCQVFYASSCRENLDGETSFPTEPFLLLHSSIFTSMQKKCTQDVQGKQWLGTA